MKPRSGAVYCAVIDGVSPLLQDPRWQSRFCLGERYMRQVFMMVMVTPLLGGCATHVASSGSVVIEDSGRAAHAGFSGRERQIIMEYYQRHKREQQAPSTGLVRQDVLPPTLPSRRLPPALEAQLAPLSQPYVRLEVGNDVVLIDRSSRVVIDIIYGVGT